MYVQMDINGYLYDKPPYIHGASTALSHTHVCIYNMYNNSNNNNNNNNIFEGNH